MWELKFNAPKGNRCMKDVFFGVVLAGLPNKPIKGYLWFTDNGQIGTQGELRGKSYSTHYEGCNSVKSFIKFLNKNTDKLKDYKVELYSMRYETDKVGTFLFDYSVSAIWEE